MTTCSKFQSLKISLLQEYAAARFSLLPVLPKYTNKFHDYTEDLIFFSIMCLQEDLSDFLAQHVMVVQHLKKLVPKTDAQSRLLKNYIKVVLSM